MERMTYLKLRSKMAARTASLVCAAAVLSAPLISAVHAFAVTQQNNLTHETKTDIYENMVSEIAKQEVLEESKTQKQQIQPVKIRAFTKVDAPVQYTAEEEQAFVEEKHITLAHHEQKSQVTQPLSDYYDDADAIEKLAKNRNYVKYESVSHLSPAKGIYAGPSGKETYYNLNMGGVVYLMRYMGYSEEEYPYWIRDDGVKMFGEYVMVAADLTVRPKGTILESSMGTAIVVDTGDLETNQLDVAVSW